MAKHQASPTAAIITPATDGPTTRARLNMIELSATALCRSSRPTISTVKDWRVGTSMAFSRPNIRASAATCQISTTPVKVSVASVSACSRKPPCVNSSSVRRSIRSAIVPPRAEKKNTGPCWRKPMNPSASGEPVRR